VTKEILEKLYKAKQESFKNKYEGCNLVVKNIPKEISEKALFEIFKSYGDVASARISTDPKFKEIKNEKGEIVDKEFVYESKGYGFVLFRNIEDARKVNNTFPRQKRLLIINNLCSRVYRSNCQ
jgi:RNA recognition motif-containing protein